MSHQSSLISEDIHAYLKKHEEKSILKFLTCGSVDDGKSTLIGRLLHDSKLIYEDQLKAIKNSSGIVGEEGKLDLALLVDGLQSEREQGITIDVAYRYFSTAKRKFIIADTPGHEQYTRNMVTGASDSDAGIILIDARPGHGVLPQTKRHAFILSLLNIPHILVAVNKMDAVGFSEDRFEEIRNAFLDFSTSLRLKSAQFIPISALNGDNIVSKSANTPWYEGNTLMHFLENAILDHSKDPKDFRFPVQLVSRPDSSFRGYAGRVASGKVSVGDEVQVLPSRKRTRVKSIETFDGQKEYSVAQESVTLCLEDEIDVSRGDMILHPDSAPLLSDKFSCDLVWMAEQPAETGSNYLIKLNNQQVVAELGHISHRVDINTLKQIPNVSLLQLNEIGQAEFSLAKQVPFDPYSLIPSTGSFVVIDRITNLTVGAGMILNHRDYTEKENWDKEPKTRRRTVRHESKISKEERAERLGFSPFTVMISGLNGSGKTALASALEKELFERGIVSTIVDGQHLRLSICKDLGFTTRERSENLRRGAEIAKILNKTGVACICSFVAPHKNPRAKAKEIIGSDNLILIHLDAPVEVCRQRDENGVFEAAERGEIPDFPGVSVEYEPVLDADLVLNTESLGIEECVQSALKCIASRGFFS